MDKDVMMVMIQILMDALIDVQYSLTGYVKLINKVDQFVVNVGMVNLMLDNNVMIEIEIQEMDVQIVEYKRVGSVKIFSLVKKNKLVFVQMENLILIDKNAMMVI